MSLLGKERKYTQQPLGEKLQFYKKEALSYIKKKKTLWGPLKSLKPI